MTPNETKWRGSEAAMDDSEADADFEDTDTEDESQDEGVSFGRTATMRNIPDFILWDIAASNLIPRPKGIKAHMKFKNDVPQRNSVRMHDIPTPEDLFGLEWTEKARKHMHQ